MQLEVINLKPNVKYYFEIYGFSRDKKDTAEKKYKILANNNFIGNSRFMNCSSLDRCKSSVNGTITSNQNGTIKFKWLRLNKGSLKDKIDFSAFGIIEKK